MQHRHIAEKYWREGGNLALDPAKLAAYTDVIDLTIGDMDVPTDGRIIDAACADAHKGYTRYGNPKGDPALISAIRAFYREEYGLAIEEDRVFVAASSLLSMQLAFFSTLNPGDEVIVFAPYFTPYKAQIELAGGVAVEVPTTMENGYAIDPTLLIGAITPRTKGLVLNNPCNPTGAFYDQSTLEKIAQIAVAKDLIVYADEIYTFYVYGGTMCPILQLPGMAERTITLNSLSKNYLMTGWRVGYVIAAPHFIKTMERVNHGIVYSAPAISQRAAIAALRLRDSIRETYIADYEKRVSYAAEQINSIPWMSVMKPQGTFYLFPSIKKTGLDSRAFADALFEKIHVLVSPGILFGNAGEGHVRMVCTAPMDALCEAFCRMHAISFA